MTGMEMEFATSTRSWDVQILRRATSMQMLRIQTVHVGIERSESVVRKAREVRVMGPGARFLARNRGDVDAEIAPSLEDQGDFDGDTPFMVVENMPAFGPCTSLSGDERNQCTQVWIIRYVSENTNYPSSAKDDGLEGTVFVYFVVGKDGNVTDVKVLREVDPRLDKEAMRVVRSLPQFEPGQQRGKPVSVQYTIPVKFIIT